jgi:N-methylhydantoinase A
MAGAIRQISIESGLDPRDFVLFSYGGGGPLHASTLAHELSIPTIIIPPEPGNFSAVGMLLANARLDLSTTFVGRLDEERLASTEAAFKSLEAEAAASLKKDFKSQDIFFERTAEMRYVGQQHSIKVSISEGATVAIVRDAFDNGYNQRYGHSDSKTAVELQTLHLSAYARLHRPDLKSLPRPTGAQELAGSRQVHFGKAGLLNATVYQRASLEPGFQGKGPAVIEEYGSTTIVWPGDWFEIGRLSEICIHCQLDKGVLA